MTRPLIRLFLPPLKALARPIAGPAHPAGLALPAAAAEYSDGDVPAIGTVIQSQIDAFQRDDGTTAYSYASPSIRHPLGRRLHGHGARRRPAGLYGRSVTFGALEEGPTGPSRKSSWSAGQALLGRALDVQRQSDGS